MYHQGPTFITQTGFQNLKDRLRILERKRTELGHDLHEVQEPGRKVENASFSTLWEEKIQVEEMVHNISTTLRNANLITRPTRRSKVMLGSKIKLKGENGLRTYMLVDSPEADPSLGMISYKSPAGSSLLGKRIGDQVEIGNGHKISYTILDIS